ncbi:MAG: stage II sporulation protein P [Oscillospiraceae bacterium]|nr:stage II sporulation protein P [Oscillospiraceae bacterium]
MKYAFRRKARRAAARRPFLLKGLAVIFFFVLIVRIAVYLGSDTLAEGFMSRLLENDNIALGILDFEFSGAANLGLMPNLQALIFDPAPVDSQEDFPAILENPAAIPPLPHPPSDSEEISGGLYYTVILEPEDSAEISRTDESSSLLAADSIVLTNTTSLEIDINSLLNEPLGINLTHGEPAVLIIHTHTSEAFTQTDGKTYISSDPYRTEDQTRNIIRVGEALAAEFERRGISVIHDRRSYDFPSFAGSYSRAYASIRSYLERYPSIRLVLDIHRDSITAPDGSQRRTIAQIGDQTLSQIMFVVGTNYAGLNHPHWQENLKLALRIQHEMNYLFPSLARPVFISGFRFNQHTTAGSLIIEVGSAGNTLTESLAAIPYFAEAAANVILALYE